MPEISSNFPQTSNIPWRDLQFRFDGRWLPDIDPALIGGNNYATIENLRYQDSGLEGVNGYTKVNTTALTTYVELQNGHQLRTSKEASHVLVQAASAGGQGRVYQNKTTIGSQGDFDTTSKFDTSGNAYFQDASSGLQGRFSDAPQGNVAYCNGEESMIFGGDEQRVAAAFTTDNNIIADRTIAYPKDRTDIINNELVSDDFTYDHGDQEFLLLMTTRPIQSVKYYVSSANAVAATQTIKTWTGTAWSADLVDTDGTDVSGATLGQTGVVTLTAHTEATAVPFHFEELFLYAYLVELVSGGVPSADIYHITVDMAFQSVKDIWDGVYRQPIQFQKHDVAGGNHYVDYTLQVNESSDLNVPIGADLGGLVTATEWVQIMFEDPMAAIRFTMLGGLVNQTAATALTVKYWDGDSFVTVGASLYDGTDGTVALDQSGLISWTQPTDEQPRTAFGSYGYIYQLEWNQTLSGVKDSSDLVIDLVTGVPAQKTVQPFDFPALFQDRLMLGGYTIGDEANRMDFSVANAPDAWNGTDSSDDGRQSLYFGNSEKIVAARQLYNRFGSNVFSMLLVLKQTELYLLIGQDPSDFRIYPVSFSIGCPAPLTLDVAEVGFEGGEGLTRNVAMWISHSGPVMFDGAVLQPIPGIENYFDPNEGEYINWAQIDKAVGWVDPVYKEYNVVIPTGSITDPNEWLCYDLVRRKWFKKSTGINEQPQTGFVVMNTTGQKMVYGGIDTGYMMRLENGTSWDGSGITMRLRTGDFFPSENIWDETTIRKLKVLSKRITTDADVNIYHYLNSTQSSNLNVIFEDYDVEWGGVADGADVDWVGLDLQDTISLTGGTIGERLIRLNADLNKTGWAHAFEFEVTTNDVTKGWEPVAWGVRYRIERKDHTAT